MDALPLSPSPVRSARRRAVLPPSPCDDATAGRRIACPARRPFACNPPNRSRYPAGRQRRASFGPRGGSGNGRHWRAAGSGDSFSATLKSSSDSARPLSTVTTRSRRFLPSAGSALVFITRNLYNSGKMRPFPDAEFRPGPGSQKPRRMSRNILFPEKELTHSRNSATLPNEEG